MTVKETAKRWKVSERLVQRLCAEERIEGAAKFGRSCSSIYYNPPPASRGRSIYRTNRKHASPSTSTK